MPTRRDISPTSRNPCVIRGDAWRNSHDPRVAIFCACNPIYVRHHKAATPPEMLEGLTTAHQPFLTEVYHMQLDR